MFYWLSVETHGRASPVLASPQRFPTNENEDFLKNLYIFAKE